MLAELPIELGLELIISDLFVTLAQRDDPFDLLFLVVNLLDGNDNVEEAVQQPEDVVNEVALLNEGWAVLPEAHTVKVKWVIREEVDGQGQIVQHFVEDHANG